MPIRAVGWTGGGAEGAAGFAGTGTGGVFAFCGSAGSVGGGVRASRGVAGVGAELDQLRAALQRGLGQQLDQLTRDDLGPRVDELVVENAGLVADFAEARKRADELVRQLAEVQDDLAGARLSLRRMIWENNQPGPG